MSTLRSQVRAIRAKRGYDSVRLAGTLIPAVLIGLAVPDVTPDKPRGLAVGPTRQNLAMIKREQTQSRATSRLTVSPIGGPRHRWLRAAVAAPACTGQGVGQCLGQMIFVNTPKNASCPPAYPRPTRSASIFSTWPRRGLLRRRKSTKEQLPRFTHHPLDQMRH